MEIAQTERERKAFFADLKSLHQVRWERAGRAGAFRSPRFSRFHERLGEALLAQRKLILLRVSVSSGPVAVLYAFVDHGACRYYQSGMDLGKCPELSPGLLSHLLVAETARDYGLTRYDLMLAGDLSSYKSMIAEPSLRLWSYRGRIARTPDG